VKRLKWVLWVIGVPVAVIALFWVDTYFRAVAAIRAEDDRLAQDIAAFRARRKPELPLDGAFLHGSSAAPWSFFRSGSSAKLEDGHSGHQGFRQALTLDLWGLTHVPPDITIPPRPAPGEPATSCLALTYWIVRESGYATRKLGYQFETKALRTLEPLVAEGLPADDLRRIAEKLDLCLAARPEDSLAAEHLMDRAEVLRVLHLKADPLCFIQTAPGWKDFFSWRILLVKCLKDLEEDYRYARMSTVTEMEEAEHRLEGEHADRRTRSFLITNGAGQWYLDREALCEWHLARTAVAIARYRADLGREPDRLEELTPEYLPQVPRDHMNGSPPEFEDGVLSFRLSQQSTLQWDVRRK